nr:hypothetical protein [Methanoregula sp.]
MTMPFMDGWIEQWYVYVPAGVNVRVLDAPVWSVSEENVSGDAVSETMVWGAASR